MLERVAAPRAAIQRSPACLPACLQAAANAVVRRLTHQGPSYLRMHASNVNDAVTLASFENNMPRYHIA